MGTKAAKEEAEKKVDAAEKKEEKAKGKETDANSKVVEAEAKLNGRKDDVKDLKQDVALAEAQMKRDNIPAKTIGDAEAAVRASNRKLRSADRKVNSARGSFRAAKETLRADQIEKHNEEATAEKKIDDLESKAEAKTDEAKNEEESAGFMLKTQKAKNNDIKRVKSKVARLRADLKEESKEVQRARREKEKARARKAREQKAADAKITKAEDQMSSITSRAVKLAKANGKKSLAAAQAALKEVQRALQMGKKKQEAMSSKGTEVKICKELVPPTITSKDEANMCEVVKQEQHCTFFDYARYCQKSCGTCLL